MLRGVKPTPHLAAQIEEARKRLEAQLAQLDQGAPVVELRPGFGLEYSRGNPVQLGFRVRDDYQVKSVKLWAKPPRIERLDWGRTAAIAIRHLTQAGRKNFGIKGAGMQIGSGLAGLQNRAHGSVVTVRLFLFPTQALFRPRPTYRQGAKLS
jgi:hypothetical protein